MSLILYCATVLPYRIAFEDDTSLMWIYIDFILDGLFWVDLVLNMLTTYYDDENNKLITSRKKVITSYLKSWFILDLFCSLPIDTIVGLFINTS